MFKQVGLLLALSASLVAAQQRLYISNDLYAIEKNSEQHIISNDEILKAGYNVLEKFPHLLNVQDHECGWQILLDEDVDATLAQVVNSSMEALNEAKGEHSEKLIEALIHYNDIRVDTIRGYPQPVVSQSEGGYNITVLAKGHCFVSSLEFGKDVASIIISPNSVTQLVDGEKLIYSGRACLEPYVQRIVDQVKVVAKDC